jgi:hypothetical protein
VKTRLTTKKTITKSPESQTSRRKRKKVPLQTTIRRRQPDDEASRRRHIFPFLELPVELQENIFQEVLNLSEDRKRPDQYSKRKPRNVPTTKISMLLLCSSTFDLFAPLYYRQTVPTLNDPTDLSNYLRDCTELRIQKLHSLALNLRDRDVYWRSSNFPYRDFNFCLTKDREKLNEVLAACYKYLRTLTTFTITWTYDEIKRAGQNGNGQPGDWVNKGKKVSSLKSDSYYCPFGYMLRYLGGVDTNRRGLYGGWMVQRIERRMNLYSNWTQRTSPGIVAVGLVFTRPALTEGE